MSDITATVVVERRSLPRKLYQRLTSSRIQEIERGGGVDAIVIGSGVSGLVTAAMMALRGLRVVVLEQHTVPGGCSHIFEERGWSFETGLHYVGNVASIQPVLNAICTEEKIEWDQVGMPSTPTTSEHYDDEESDTTEVDAAADGVYDVITIGEDHYRFPATAKKWIAEMCRRFPTCKDGEAIRAFVDLCLRVSGDDSYYRMQLVRWRCLRRLLRRWLCPIFHEYAHRSTADVVASLTENRRLRAVLCGNFGDMGPTPDTLPFVMMAGVFTHYMDGGFFPRGGPGTIAESIVPGIVRAGGYVIVNALVTDINVAPYDNSGVTGVTVVAASRVKQSRGGGGGGGDDVSSRDDVQRPSYTISAPIVVSSAGVVNTYDNLLRRRRYPLCEEDVFTIPFRQRLQKFKETVGPSVSYTCLYIALRGDGKNLQSGGGAGSVGLPSHNNWVFPTHGDYERAYREYAADPLNPDVDVPVFIAFGSAKDSDWSRRHPGKSTATVLAPSNFDWYAEWAQEPSGRRSAAYEERKRAEGNRLLDAFLRQHPHLRDCIEFTTVGTPLTTQHYLRSAHGEAYGANMSSQRLTDFDDLLSPFTPVKNLFMTGQDTVTPGVAGALWSGVLTAHAALGYGVWSWLRGESIIPL